MRGLRAALLCGLLALSTTSACTTRLGDLTVASPRNVPAELKVLERNVTGEDCMNQILGIPVGTLNPTLDEAIDNALDPVAGADALVDVSIKQSLLFLLLYTKVCIQVEGDAVSTR